jgi:hypothetical protein
MWAHSQPWQPGSLLKQAAMSFVLFAYLVMIATSVAVFKTHPELRNPAAWMPYDVTAEARVSGVIEEVQEFECPWSGPRGTHLMLRTAGGTVQVHVADATFLRAQHVIFNRGDQIEVLGQKLAFDGHEALIARELNRGGNRFAVRDTQGKPLWLSE